MYECIIKWATYKGYIEKNTIYKAQIGRVLNQMTEQKTRIHWTQGANIKESVFIYFYVYKTTNSMKLEMIKPHGHSIWDTSNRRSWSYTKVNDTGLPLFKWDLLWTEEVGVSPESDICEERLFELKTPLTKLPKRRAGKSAWVMSVWFGVQYFCIYE